MAEKRNLAYIPPSRADFHHVKHLLDVFYPDDSKGAAPVLVYIHGGTWMNGSKDIYSSFGVNLSKNGIVAVIINYRLGDIVDFRKMALDCAAAIKWVFNNISEYNGNRNRIRICGHSAGGHLAALVSLNFAYFDQLNMDNPIKSCILIDAFGLNIGSFIASHGAMYLEYIEKVFTRNPEVWKEASPVNFVSHRKIPFMILVGSNTYPILMRDNETFYNELRKINPKVSYEVVKGKSHVEMISQFNDKNYTYFKNLIDFVKAGS